MILLKLSRWLSNGLVKVLLAIVFPFQILCHAGNVRTIETTDEEMNPIYLSMGKSTILNFVEMPLKISIGNKNYYNIEFINNDLSIQPLGSVSTNLFVYGKYHRYGLILHVQGNGPYDDLVKMRWKSDLQKNLFSSNSLDKILSINIEKIEFDPKRKFFIIDLSFKNFGENPIILHEFLVMATLGKSKKSISIKEVVFQKDQLHEINDQTKARIIIQISEPESILLEIKYGKMVKSLPIEMSKANHQ